MNIGKKIQEGVGSYVLRKNCKIIKTGEPPPCLKAKYL